MLFLSSPVLNLYLSGEFSHTDFVLSAPPALPISVLGMAIAEKYECFRTFLNKFSMYSISISSFDLAGLGAGFGTGLGAVVFGSFL